MNERVISIDNPEIGSLHTPKNGPQSFLLITRINTMHVETWQNIKTLANFCRAFEQFRGSAEPMLYGTFIEPCTTAGCSSVYFVHFVHEVDVISAKPKFERWALGNPTKKHSTAIALLVLHVHHEENTLHLM